MKFMAMEPLLCLVSLTILSFSLDSSAEQGFLKGSNYCGELLPYSEQGNKESVMDDAVDYIKYLQLQLKTLSQNTLGGEPTEDPFINLEGFGNYLLNQEKLTEPFEEVIGKLMEDNKPAFIQLLESKGLSVLPMALAGGLSQAM